MNHSQARWPQLFLLRCALLLGFALCILASPTSVYAWSTIPCNIDNNKRNAFPNGDKVWPLTFSKSMPRNSWAHKAIERAMKTWNLVPGAKGSLRTTGNFDYTNCKPNENNGFGVVMWDQGTCYNWGSGSYGQNIYWTKDCVLTRIVVAFNSAKSFTADQLSSTALHELGHYQHYAHNWDEVSTMGYHKTTTLPFLFLSARDHSYLRSIFPDTNTRTAPDLHIHRFVKLAKVIPDQVSFDNSPPPTCKPYGCQDLRKGDTISVTLTTGNTGSMDTTGPVETRMTLEHPNFGTHVLGTWKTSGPFLRETQYTYEYIGTIPEGIPPATYTLKVEINPGRKVNEKDSPSGANNAVVFSKFTVKVPTSWTCKREHYNSSDGCHCGCGAYDLDCRQSKDALGCDDKNPCTANRCDNDGRCRFEPQEGTCDDGKYCTSNDRCQKGVCQGQPRDCGAKNDRCFRYTCDEARKQCIAASTGAPNCAAPENPPPLEKTIEPPPAQETLNDEPIKDATPFDSSSKDDNSKPPPMEGCQCQNSPAPAPFFLLCFCLLFLRRFPFRR